MEIKYLKSAARLLNRDYANRRGLNLSKEVLWVSVGQRAADLWAFKVGGQQKILPISPARVSQVRAGRLADFFFKPPTLMHGSSAFL